MKNHLLSVLSMGIVLPLLVACNQPKSSHPYPTGTLQEQLQADYTRFGVQMHSYEFFDLEDTPAPTGYTPFYISHYGRHGSRSNWGSGDYDQLIAILTSAKTAGVLTPAGDTLLEKTKQVRNSYNTMDGRLTDRGEREHARMAERMYKRYPSVFDVPSPRVISIGSLVPRCLISMAAFTNQLTRMNPAILYNFDTGEVMQKYIDCCGHMPKEAKQRYHFLLDSLSSALPYDSTVVLERLFTSVPDTMQNVSVRHLQHMIYHTCIVAQDFDLALNILDFMDFSTAYYYHMRNTWEFVIQMCNVEGAGSERIHNAQIALNEFVASADSAISSFTENPDSPIVANLRFGHDLPLLCIVSRMGISGVGSPMKAEEIEGAWYAHLNVCMASNLQLVFYRNKENDILVKALYNERERAIEGLTPVTGPYYKWADVRQKWEQ